MKTTLSSRLAFAALAACSLALTARADTAIVVGVNRYSKLPNNKQLRGAVNDANSIVEKLKGYGFSDPVVLTDGQATKQGILDALRSAKSKNKPNERFVFYFAGHGTNSAERGAIILPSDASADETSADFLADDLKKEVDAVPASTRTILLDSCFSGGMTRSAKSLGKSGLRTRFIERRSNSRLPVRANREQFRRGAVSGANLDKSFVRKYSNNGGGEGKVSSVCYVVGAGPDEYSHEDVFDGQSGGVFTHFLSQQLDGSKKSWGTVMEDVTGEVREYLEGLQKPEMSPDYSGKIVFEGGGGKVDPGPAPNNLWDLYNSDQPDPNIVNLTVDPNSKELKVNKDFDLYAQVGSTGYVVVLELDNHQNVNLLYPEKPNVGDAQVSPGKLHIGNFHPDSAGTEQVKAIYLKDEAAVRQILSVFNDKANSGTNNRSVNTRKLRVVLTTGGRPLVRTKIKPNDSRTFVTSDLNFGVTDN